MSAVEWSDWSCAVRVVVDDGRGAGPTPTAATVRAKAHVRALMDDVSRAVSRFRDDSDLSRVNAGTGRLVPVGALTMLLVGEALEAARRTDGACDPTVGRHLVEAGYDADISTVRRRPASGRAMPARAAGVTRMHDWTSVRVDESLRRVGVPAGVALDLGATAKAWTADEAATVLAQSLNVPVLVSIGGDVAVSDDHVDGAPGWPVLVSEHALPEPSAGQVVDLAGGGLATSSTRGRTWTTGDGEQHHVIDPATGRPAHGAYRTASVIAATCVEANALSTAALVWGDQAPDRLAGHPARLVTVDGRVVTTPLWPQGPTAQEEVAS